MKLILGWTTLALTALFVAFNLERADVWFFGFRVQMPVSFVVIAAALLGALTSYALTSLKRKP